MSEGFGKALGNLQAAKGGGSSSSSGGNNISGHFDPTALERGAKALKELDQSANAGRAFEITKVQEQTKQKEYQAQIEKEQSARAEMNLRRSQIDGDEKRKTLAAQEDQERRTAQYKTQLESELYQHKLEDQQKQNEQWLAQQQQQYMRQEEIRKKNDLELEGEKRRSMQEQAMLDRETASVKAAAEAKARTQQERENVDVRIREMRATKAEERVSMMEHTNLIMTNLSSGLNTLLADKDKMAALVSGVCLIAAGVYAAKNATRVGGNLAERALSRPPLVRETSKFSFIGNNGIGQRGLLGNAMGFFKQKQKGIVTEKIVLQEELQTRLDWTTNSLVNAKANKAPMRHILLHGPPGTGKTLFARTLAQNSGLDYAIMSGGDVGPLGKDAVDEVNKLFDWAGKSKKGMILFIDEAEAFLKRGRGGEGKEGEVMSEHARNVISAFLHHTGTETDKFSVVLATNVPGMLDRAVLDRVDESFLFPLPDMKQRVAMIKQFFQMYIVDKESIEVEEAVSSDAYMEHLANATNGMSGRQIAKTILAFQSAVFGSGTKKLTKGLADSILEWKLATIQEDAKFMADPSSTLESRATSN